MQTKDRGAEASWEQMREDERRHLSRVFDLFQQQWFYRWTCWRRRASYATVGLRVKTAADSARLVAGHQKRKRDGGGLGVAES